MGAFAFSRTIRFRWPARFLLAFVACQQLVGCSTPLVPINNIGPVRLASGEALLAVQIDTDVELSRVNLTGLRISEPVGVGTHFWISRIPAGTYHWTGVEIAAGIYRGRYRIKDDAYERPEELMFRAVPGKINYAGKLIVRRSHFGGLKRWITIRIRNNAAEALRQVNLESPALLDQFPLHTASMGGDRFLEYYAAERERISQPASKVPPSDAP